MGQTQTCGVQLEKTSCPCFQSPKMTSYSPSSSKEIGLIVPETNPSLLTEARDVRGSPAWRSGERAPASSAVLLMCQLWHCSVVALGQLRLAWVLPHSRNWGPWVVPAGCWWSRQLPCGWPLRLAALALRTAHLRCPWVHGRAGFQLHPATSASHPESASS